MVAKKNLTRAEIVIGLGIVLIVTAAVFVAINPSKLFRAAKADQLPADTNRTSITE